MPQCPFRETNPEEYKDGYCDRELNNPECQYDGGDCCGPKYPFWDYYCGDACECLDPDYEGIEYEQYDEW